eukprot:m.435024 g.435024  ORF g.435024 m.435024 type:complete len:387 (+) comp56760_c0_seq34:179-1339(+)
MTDKHIQDQLQRYFQQVPLDPDLASDFGESAVQDLVALLTENRTEASTLQRASRLLLPPDEGDDVPHSEDFAARWALQFRDAGSALAPQRSAPMQPTSTRENSSQHLPGFPAIVPTNILAAGFPFQRPERPHATESSSFETTQPRGSLLLQRQSTAESPRISFDQVEAEALGRRSARLRSRSDTTPPKAPQADILDPAFPERPMGITPATALRSKHYSPYSKASLKHKRRATYPAHSLTSTAPPPRETVDAALVEEATRPPLAEEPSDAGRSRLVMCDTCHHRCVHRQDPESFVWFRVLLLETAGGSLPADSKCQVCGGQLDAPIPKSLSGYTCYVCARDFRSSDRLIAHASKHNGRKAFTCAECGKGFSRQPRLLEHQRRYGHDG